MAKKRTAATPDPKDGEVDAPTDDAAEAPAPAASTGKSVQVTRNGLTVDVDKSRLSEFTDAGWTRV